jgi:hypothetical protein
MVATLSAGRAFGAGPSTPEEEAARKELEGEIRKKMEKERLETWEANRQKAIRAFDKARRDLARGEEKARKVESAKRPEAFKTLQQAREDCIEAALALYVAGGKDDRARMRGFLEFGLARPHGWKSLLESLERSVIAGEGSPEELLQLFRATREKLTLARALTRPENRAVLGAVLDELRKRYQVNIPPPDEVYDFGVVFEMLRDLNSLAYQEVAEQTKAKIGTYDPEAPPEHDRIVVVVVHAEDIAAEDVDGFRDAFASWMKAASQDEPTKAVLDSGWSSKKVEELMAAAEQKLSGKTQSGACAENSGLPFAKLLCPLSYAGVVAVEVERSESGLRAFASWRVRDRGPELSRADRFPSGGFEFSRPEGDARSRAAQSRLRGDDFALQVLIKGTVFKRVSEAFKAVASSDPDLMRKNGLVAPSVPVPCKECEAPPRCPDSAPKQGNAWHGLLFAGMPYLEDEKGSGFYRGMFSTIDVATIGGGLATLGWSVRLRNQYAGGDTRAFDRANDYLTASAVLLISAAAVRLAASGCYWMRWCR